ncbi:MAG: electron transfer flavoprotein subunit alpha/FixB family protein, partial [Gammaproteobacteria bacterium]|nr:electron transfer flavoprotein subunit alpha/FixB family protein [Gammaproteobacteria bacterium]
MNSILVIAEQRRGELMPSSLECIGAAVELKSSNNSTVIVAIIAANASEFVSQLSLEGVDEVITIVSPVAHFQADFSEAAALSLINDRQPSLVLAPHSVDAWGYIPALATTGNYGIASDVFAIRYEDGNLIATRAAYAEKLHQELEFPSYATTVLTVRGNTFKVIEQSGNP